MASTISSIPFNFLNSLSNVIAERCVNKHEIINKTLPRSLKYGNIVDAVTAFPKEAFIEFVNKQAQKENLPLDAKHVWKEIKHGDGRTWLEILINGKMRENHQLNYDLVFTKDVVNTRKWLTFNFRVSGELPTQSPQHYFPLFVGPFEEMIEVIQGQYAITCSSSKQPIVASWRFASCIGFAAFNEEHHIGVLAHIDEFALSKSPYAILGNLFEDIQKTHAKDAAPLEFKYVLIGGCTEAVSSSVTCDAREYVKICVEAASNEHVSFTLIEEVGSKISNDVFQEDAAWTESMRLRRSIALDIRKNSFSEALMSYEPELNPASSLHKRERSRLEARTFELKREQYPELTGVTFLS